MMGRGVGAPPLRISHGKDVTLARLPQILVFDPALLEHYGILQQSAPGFAQQFWFVHVGRVQFWWIPQADGWVLSASTTLAQPRVSY